MSNRHLLLIIKLCVSFLREIVSAAEFDIVQPVRSLSLLI